MTEFDPKPNLLSNHVWLMLPASIVFGVIVMDANLPGGRFIGAVAVTTVILGLVAHGVPAKLLAAWLGRNEVKRAAPDTS